MVKEVKKVRSADEERLKLLEEVKRVIEKYNKRLNLKMDYSVTTYEEVATVTLHDSLKAYIYKFDSSKWCNTVRILNDIVNAEPDFVRDINKLELFADEMTEIYDNGELHIDYEEGALYDSEDEFVLYLYDEDVKCTRKDEVLTFTCGDDVWNVNFYNSEIEHKNSKDIENPIEKQFNKMGDNYGSTVWMQNGYIGQEDENVVCIKDYEDMKCDDERYYFKLKDKVVFVDLELDYISVL